MTADFSRKKLRIGIVSGLLHPRFGGPAAVIRSHVDALSDKLEIQLFGVVDRNDQFSVKKQYPDAHLFRLGSPTRWYRGIGLSKSLGESAPNLDLIHAHMLWDQPVYSAWKVSKQHKIPLIITPHGSLIEEWRYRSLSKKIYKKLIVDRMLKDAAAVHVLTPIELNEMLRIGFGENSVVIPNGVSEQCFQISKSRAAFDKLYPQLSGFKIVAYIGRLWGEKGLDILPDAWARVIRSHPNARLVIAGPDFKNYTNTLKNNVSRLNLDDYCILTGPLYDEQKIILLSATDLLVLPSRSEALSMSIIEAAAAGVPCLFTAGCNVDGLSEIGGGWLVDRDSTSLADKIINILSKPREELLASGELARNWAYTNYHMRFVEEKLLTLYRSAVSD